MAEAAGLPLDYPDTGKIEEDSLAAQSLALAAELPDRPLVLGGCCCTHIGAVQGLASRHERIAVVWFDAHGDLNTPESSPSGNAWGMPLRMLIDGGAVAPRDVALVGARTLDPPEAEFIAASGIHDTPAGALADADCVYVAFDLDVLDPADAAPFMPETGGPRLAAAEAVLGEIAAGARVVGAGFTGATADPGNLLVIERLASALRL
jgi:arginase